MTKDWNPSSYTKFSGERLQPALDLLGRIGELPEGDICDLGCGTGVMGPVLKAVYPDRQLSGFDKSPAMIEEAKRTAAYDRLSIGDAANWEPEEPLALIFSNALLHWLPGHETLLPRLASFLKQDGRLAVQMPYQNDAPSHRLWLELAGELFPGRFDPSSSPGILNGPQYFSLLSGLGDLALWETIYYQHLNPAETGHPVRHFTISTYARPVLAVLEDDEQEELISAYDREMDAAYPKLANGSVLFPFRRMFFVLSMPG